VTRKLLILDVALAVGVIFGAYQLHEQMTAAKLRQAGMPGPAPKPGALPATVPMGQKPAVAPSGYKEIADKLLFDASRNPNIVIEKAPEPAPPPPPVPPPLPVFHGMMDLGDGPFAMMTESGQSHYIEVHRGGMIGPFKLLSFNREEFEVEWNGKVIRRRADEADEERARPGAAVGTAPAPAVTKGIVPGVAAPEVAPSQQSKADLGPGQPLSDTVRTCQPGDGSPAGTVSDGYRKQLKPNPFGTSQCLWVAIGK